jgi:hypothetical protein
MAKRVVTYEELVEQAAESLDAWKKLQAVHAMKVRGGTPEIRWSRKHGYKIVDLSAVEEPERERLAS